MHSTSSYNGDQHQRGSTEIEVPSFSLKELKEKTGEFGSTTLIGEGSYGSVYLAQLEDGKAVAVKKLYVSDSNVDFLAQVSLASRLKNDNVVELLGYCVVDNLRVLAYEYATMGSLHDILHGRKGGPTLDWMHRVKIAVDAARGLEYLHDNVQPSIVHRYVTSSNVLVFEDYRAKIGDFNLLYEAPDTCNADVQPVKHNYLGCYDPEYFMAARMTKKSDVFSFGVVLLELLTGKKPIDRTRPFEKYCLVDWAKQILPRLRSLSGDNDEVKQFIDPKLKYYPLEGVAQLASVAVLCVQYRAKSRPYMSDVVKALEHILIL